MKIREWEGDLITFSFAYSSAVFLISGFCYSMAGQRDHNSSGSCCSWITSMRKYTVSHPQCARAVGELSDVTLNGDC